MAVTRRTLLATSLAVPAVGITSPAHADKVWHPNRHLHDTGVGATTAAAPAAPVRTLLGASFHSGESLPNAVDRLDFHRFFFQPGRMLAPRAWGQQPPLVKAYSQYGCRSYSISFKPDGGGTVAFTRPDNIRYFLDTVPGDVDPGDVYLTFFHEHDGNIRKGSLSRSLYRSGSEQVAGIAGEYGMRYGPIHNGITLQGTWGLWPTQWALNEPDLDLCTFWGVDLYSNRYEDPSWMDPAATYAGSLGLPLLIGEIASPADNGQRQEQWAGKARDWCLEYTERASWWSSQVDDDATNYRLNNGSARAWFGL